MKESAKSSSVFLGLPEPSPISMGIAWLSPDKVHVIGEKKDKESFLTFKSRCHNISWRDSPRCNRKYFLIS